VHELRLANTDLLLVALSIAAELESLVLGISSDSISSLRQPEIKQPEKLRISVECVEGFANLGNSRSLSS